MDKRCQCCLSPNNLMEFTENYANLIVSCFSIEVSTISFDKSKNLICDSCVGKIKESSAFRNQILISQSKLKEFQFPTMTNDNIKHEPVFKSEPVCKEEFLSDCEIDDFDNSVNRTCVIQNLNIQTKNELNESLFIENKFSDFDTLNSSIERNETFSEANISFQTRKESNLTIIPIQKLQKTSTKENTLKSDPRHENDKSYPFNIHKTALTCEVCSETFTTHSLLLSHVGIHFPSIHICHVCEKIFSNRDRIVRHMKRHDETMSPCLTCEKLIRPSYMNVHVKIHEKYLRFKCSQCSERFTTEIRRLKHTSKAHNVDIYKFQCDVCPKKFYSRGCLNQHVKICHTTKSKLVCDFCGKRFHHEVYLEVHMREHAGECPICHKKYKIVAFLANHMATYHNGEYFKCTQCSSEYTRESYLLAHMKNKHPQLCSSS